MVVLCSEVFFQQPCCALAALMRRVRWAAVLAVCFVSVCFVATDCKATLNLSADADARARVASGTSPDATLEIFGASVRKTLADDRGDRLILFALFESEKGFETSSEQSLHEIYAQLKGPLGAWNITVGRFGLPWGLLPGFSARRLLYNTSHMRVLGMEVDSGIKVSGVSGPWDYGVSLTRGYGPHNTVDAGSHGIATGRIGITPGDTEEFSLGLSGVWGRSINVHSYQYGAKDHKDSDRALLRAVAGFDVTWYAGRWLVRSEVSAGEVDKQTMTAFFASADYALTANLDVNLAVNISRQGSDDRNEWFAGLTRRLPWFILRGGYRYVGNSEARNQLTVQLYRLFSFTF